MILSSICDKCMTSLCELIGESLSVGLYLLAIVLELWCSYLLQLCCKSSDLVIMRATLEHWEYCEINLLI